LIVAGRPSGPTGVRLTEAHRAKIQNSNILNALIEHAEGRREMSATQVTAGLGLLKKALPDLSAITIGGDEDNPIAHKHKHELAAEQFLRAIDRIAGRRGPEDAS